MLSKPPPCAIVTGASSGIGRAIAKKLLSNGWHVHALDIAKGNFNAQGVHECLVDLTDSSALEIVLERLLAMGLPQAVVHAAGVLRAGPLGQLESDAGEQMWRLHVDVATRLANRFLPLMHQARQGRMVLSGSRVSGGISGKSQYAATKAALASLARSWAAESIERGVTVNVVSPAATDTPMLHDPARTNTPPKLPPIGRLIQPDEVAALVLYLLGPQASAITGQDITICGGASVVH